MRAREIKYNIGVIFQVFCQFGQTFPYNTNFKFRVHRMDVINGAKFYRSRLRGSHSEWVEFWPFPLDCVVAVNTVWTTGHDVILIIGFRIRKMSVTKIRVIIVVLKHCSQIHLHDANDIPLVSNLGFFVEPGKHSLVTVDYSKVR